jgi:Sec-independent protein secretion pathway component TatC
VIFAQLYAFVAPGLLTLRRKAFAPYLVATPVFRGGALLVYFVVAPGCCTFLSACSGNGAGARQIELLPRVSEYLSLIMTLIFAFGITFQLPVVFNSFSGAWNRDIGFLRQRRYAIVLVCRRRDFDSARHIFHAGACRSGPGSLRAVNLVRRHDREEPSKAGGAGALVFG